MSQSTPDPTNTPEATTEQTSARSTAPARRRRHPAPRNRDAQRVETAAIAEQPAPEIASPANTAPEQPQAPVAMTSTTPANDASEAAPARPRTRARNQRSRGSTRKSDVQLVISPNDAAPTQSEPTPVSTEEAAAPTLDAAATTPDIAEITAVPAAPVNVETQSSVSPVRLVPVTTPGAEQQTPATTAAATPPAATQEPASRRYRFDRRPSQVIPGAATRPERLSGSLTVNPPTPEPVATAPAEPTATSAPAAEPIVGDTGAVRVEPESPTKPAMFTVSEPAPEDTETFFPGETQNPQQATRDAIDDIVSALGLRGLPVRSSTPVTEPAAASAEPDTSEAEDHVEATDGEQGSADDGESQSGTRRRRRRRRGSANGATSRASESAEDESEETRPEQWPVEPDQLSESNGSAFAANAEREDRNGFDPYNPYESLYADQDRYSPYRGARSQPQRDRAQRAQPSPEWDIANAQRQLRETESPFGAPEPSFARGFGPQPAGVAEPLRESYSRPSRSERGVDTPPISPNQLAATITNAIQQQTDRLLTVLRQQNPPSMTVTLPALPSTERVGVFVDVANLLYSSRSMRISIDFGRMLDFLRGNRRLIRAHAYAPTNPDPRAEQAFLSAVKGLGYRITTKNYKTFSSGAKKADMDLDLCMDIVRMVDAGALDTVVLVSGDGDFLPLLEYCSDHGVRVEVAAFDDSAAMILRQSCDLFINLSLVDDIRA